MPDLHDFLVLVLNAHGPVNIFSAFFDEASVSIFGCVSRTSRAFALQALSCIEHHEHVEFEFNLRSVLHRLQARRTARTLLSESEAANLDRQLFSLFRSDNDFLLAPVLVELLNSGASLSSFPDNELQSNLERCWMHLLSAVVPPLHRLNANTHGSAFDDLPNMNRRFEGLAQLMVTAGNHHAGFTNKTYVGNGGCSIGPFLIRALASGNGANYYHPVPVGWLGGPFDMAQRWRLLSLFQTMVYTRLASEQVDGTGRDGTGSVIPATSSSAEFDEDDWSIFGPGRGSPVYFVEFLLLSVATGDGNSNQLRAFFRKMVRFCDWAGVAGPLTTLLACPLGCLCSWSRLRGESLSSTFAIEFLLSGLRVLWRARVDAQRNDEVQRSTAATNSEQLHAWAQGILPGLLGSRSCSRNMAKVLTHRHIACWVLGTAHLPNSVARELVRMRRRTLLLALQNSGSPVWLLARAATGDTGLLRYAESKQVRGCKMRVIALLETWQQQRPVSSSSSSSPALGEVGTGLPVLEFGIGEATALDIIPPQVPDSCVLS
jgi:hypothetical protein